MQKMEESEKPRSLSNDSGEQITADATRQQRSRVHSLEEESPVDDTGNLYTYEFIGWSLFNRPKT